jgi:serine/threonine protein kinase
MPILTTEERLGQLVAKRYRLERVLSIGGMSVLFAALDETGERRVAVKMLKPTDSLDSDRVARFVREARIATALRHPNIVEVLDVGVDDCGVPFLVMELLTGHSLEQELGECGVLPLTQVLAIVLPIADALSAAHAAGVIHRDIKPANIFLTKDKSGAVTSRLLDFGIAKNLGDEFETQTGLVVGTPAYMAPEQAQHRECGTFTDVWGMGAVIYRCLAGNPPHSASAVPELLARLLREPVPPLRVAGVSKRVCATVDRALARDPSQRYPSMTAFARALVASSDVPSSGPSTESFSAVVAAQASSVPNVSISSELPAVHRRQQRSQVPWRKSGLAAIVSGGLALGLGGIAAFGGARERAILPQQIDGRTRATASVREALVRAEQAVSVRTVLDSSEEKAEIGDPSARAKRNVPSQSDPARGHSPRSRVRSRRSGKSPASVGTLVDAPSGPAPREPSAKAVGPAYEKTTGLPVASEW